MIALVTEWTAEDGTKNQRNENSDLGGTMRLGAQICKLDKNSTAYKIYDNREQITERHRHRYEVNNQYVDALVENGMVVSGRSADGNLVEMIELPDHPWFVACQFHPEFTSTPRDANPLFKHFILAARAFNQKENV